MAMVPLRPRGGGWKLNDEKRAEKRDKWKEENSMNHSAGFDERLLGSQDARRASTTMIAPGQLENFAGFEVASRVEKRVEMSLHLEQQQVRSGDAIGGVAKIRVLKDIATRGVRIKWMGDEQTKWNQGQGASSKLHFGSHEIFKRNITLWGKERGDKHGDNPILKAGFTHDWPFQLPVAKGTAPSVEVGNGFRQYTVTFYIEIPGGNDIRVEHAIPVHSVCYTSSLAKEPFNPRCAVQPVPCDHDVQVRMAMCLNRGKVKISCIFRRTVYSLAEGKLTGVCDATIDNRTTQNVRAIVVELRQMIKYKSGKGCVHEDEVVVSKKRLDNLGVPAGKSLKCQVPVKLSLKKESGVQPSCSGDLLSIIHNIVLRVDVPMAPDPEAILPVTLTNQLVVDSDIPENTFDAEVQAPRRETLKPGEAAEAPPIPESASKESAEKGGPGEGRRKSSGAGAPGYAKASSVSKAPKAGGLDLRSQFREMLQAKGMDVEDLYHKMDRNEDDKVTLPELTKAIIKLGWSVDQGEIGEWFKTMDRNASNSISLKELKAYIGPMDKVTC